MGNGKSPFMDSRGREGSGRQGRQLDDRRRQSELSVEARLHQEFSAAGNGDYHRGLSGQGWGEPRGRRQSHVHRWPKTVSRRVGPWGRSEPSRGTRKEVNPASPILSLPPAEPAAEREFSRQREEYNREVHFFSTHKRKGRHNKK